MNNPSAQLLNHLLEMARDGERFFRDAAERAGSQEFRATCNQMGQLHQRLMDELAEQVSARGETPSDHRTLRGTARQAYADARAAFTLDRDAVYRYQFEAIERRLLHRYEDALAQADAESTRQVLRRQLLLVRYAHERMRALRDQSLAA